MGSEQWSAGELADRAGVTVRTLHHYEHVGLLAPERTAAGHRRYCEADLARVLAIAALRSLGMGLAEIEAGLQDRSSLRLALRRREGALVLEGTELRRRQARTAAALALLDKGREMNDDDWRNVMGAEHDSENGDACTSGAVIRTMTGSGSEAVAKARVEEVLRLWDISRYRYTDTIVIGDDARSFSHPELTFRTADLVGSDQLVLATILRGQMHWAAMTLPGTLGAIEDAQRRHPDPPAPTNVNGSPVWIHFPVCLLHRDALVDLLGEEAGRRLFADLPYFRWIHEDLLTPWGDELRDRHGLTLPKAPPAWDDPETFLRVPGGPTVRLVSGHPLERHIVQTLADLHRQHDLSAVLLSAEIAVTGVGRPTATPIPTLGTRLAFQADGVLAHYVEAQHQWHAITTGATVPNQLISLVPESTRLPRATVEAIVVACDATLTTLTKLVGPSRAAALLLAHPLNSTLYQALIDARPAVAGIGG